MGLYDFSALRQMMATTLPAMQQKSWWPSYVQAQQSGDPNQVIAWATYQAPQFADFDGATDGDFVGKQVASMQSGQADRYGINPNVYESAGQVGGTLGAIGLAASLAYAGGVGLGTLGEGAGAGAVGADAAAGGAGTDALAGGAAAEGAGAGATAGGATTAGAVGGLDIGGGMSVDAYGNVVGAGAGTGAGAATAAPAAYDLGSGMSVDAYGNVVSGASTGGAGLGGILSNPGAIGAGLGALVGGQAGGSKPAGTTTSTSDVPPWLMPYVTGNLNAATGVRDSLASGPNATDAAMPGYMATINGDYLNPDSNPYLKDTFQHAANLVGANVDSRFESAGRYGSGAHQGVLQEGFNNLANQIYGGNYQAERARQAAAITGAPTFDTGRATAAYAPYTDYANLFPGKSTATTSPYFTNTAGGILGGALAGSQISKMFL